MAKPKTWREKLAFSNGLPKVEPLTGKTAERLGGGTVVIPAPLEVDALMKRVPAGKLVTIAELRAALAERHGADMACPFTTGIFAWMSAHAAEEAAEEGETGVTPYWRILKTGGELNPKYPGGLERLRARLEAEGHRIVTKGKRLVVEGYQHSLHPLKAE